MVRSVKFSAFTPEDVERMYAKRDSVRSGATSASPGMDPGENIRLASGKVEPPFNHHDNQFAVDAHGPGYSNDVDENSWLRGGGDGLSDATAKPGFDHSLSRNKMRR